MITDEVWFILFPKCLKLFQNWKIVILEYKVVSTLQLYDKIMYMYVWLVYNLIASSSYDMDLKIDYWKNVEYIVLLYFDNYIVSSV